MLRLIAQKKNNLLILALFFVCALVTYPSSLSLVNEWMKWGQTLSHGFACLALFVFFVWNQVTVSESSASVSKSLILLLGINSIFWCFSLLGNLQLPGYIFALTNFWFYLAGIFGWSAARAFLPVCAIFLFALPVWSILNDLLIDISSYVVGFALSFLDLTLYLQDNQIMTPWGTIIIADGCSGLRYLTISLLLAYLLCLINCYHPKTAVILFVVAALLGLVTNWIRIVIIVLIGYYTELHHGLVRNHEFFGWILFSSILFPALYFSPQLKPKPNVAIVRITFSWLLIIAGLLGPIIYFLTPFSQIKNPINLSALESTFPSSEMNYYLPKPELIINLPPADKVATYISVQEVPIYIELMTRTPKQKNEKIVPYFGKIYDTFSWRVKDTINLHDSRINIIENRLNQQKILLMYKYQVGSFTTYDYYQAKLLQIPAKLMNQSYFGFWVAQASCELTCEKEISAMKDLNLKW